MVARVDDESADQAYLLLRAAVTVIPIRPVLHNRNPVNKCFARCDSCKTQPGHAIHLCRNTNAVPVKRSPPGGDLSRRPSLCLPRAISASDPVKTLSLGKLSCPQCREARRGHLSAAWPYFRKRFGAFVAASLRCGRDDNELLGFVLARRGARVLA